MKVKNLLDSIYLIPVLLEHYKSPSAQTAAILKDNDIDPEEFRDLQHLLQYHRDFICSGVQNYLLLRIGLSEYFDKYLSEVWSKLEIVDKQLMLLDYASGNGQYSDKFLEMNPDSCAICIDKDHIGAKVKRNKFLHNVNFEYQPDWWYGYKDQIDIVLMSELLHCKEPKDYVYLLSSANNLLKPTGKLILIENNDNCMAYRISKLKGRHIPLPDMAKVNKITEGFGLQCIKLINIKNHWIYVFEKIQQLPRCRKLAHRKNN